MDVLTPEQRRLNMSRVRSRDTKPEMVVRRGLHRLGFRFRLHVKALPGCPDLVFPKYRAVVLVNGCFWHGHGCGLCKPPKTRALFWEAKISANVARDERNSVLLRELGWRVFTVWECVTRGTGRLPETELLRKIELFLSCSVSSSD